MSRFTGVAGRILPEEGDPNGLYKLVSDFRDSKQREAMTAAQLQTMLLGQESQRLNIAQGQFDLAQAREQAPLRSEILRNSLKAGQQGLAINETNQQIAAQELLRLKDEAADRPRRRMIDTLYAIPKTMKEVGKVAADISLTNARTSQIQAAIKSEAENRAAEAAAKDPNTPEGRAHWAGQLSEALKTQPWLANIDPKLLQETFKIDPTPVVSAYRQQQALEQQAKERTTAMEANRGYFVGLAREAMKAGNRQGVLAAIGELAKNGQFSPMLDQESRMGPEAYRSALATATMQTVQMYPDIAAFLARPQDPDADQGSPAAPNPTGRGTVAPNSPQAQAFLAQQNAEARARAMEQSQQRLYALANNDRMPPAPATRPAAPATQPATQPSLPRPQSRAEVDALPSGSRYLAPDGTVRIKR